MRDLEEKADVKEVQIGGLQGYIIKKQECKLRTKKTKKKKLIKKN